MAKVALVQMTSSTNIEDNLKHVEQLCLLARDQGAKLVQLPENFAFMGLHEQDKLQIAENYREGPIQSFVSALAKKMGLWIVAGTIPLKTLGTRIRASSILFDDQGHFTARYDKIHLFDVRVSDTEAHQESLTTERGEELVVVDTPVGKLGMTVCYDLRFPELYQGLVARGAEILSVPSAFTAVTGKAHWEVLLRARAVENLAYVLAADQSGEHENGRHTYGHSMVVEPWGRVLAVKESGSGLLMADLDLERLHQLRRQFPCLNHHVL